MGHPKDIFKNRAPLTDQEIQDYLSGKLSGKQRKEVELKMAQDEFNLAAMTGYEETPEALNGFDLVKDKVNAHITKEKRGWKFHHTIILCAALSVGMMFLGPFLFPNHGQTTDVSQDTEETEEIAPEVIEEDVQSDIVELSDEEIEAAVVLEEFELVHAKEVITSSPVIIDSALSSNPAEEEIAINESIEIKKIAANTSLDNIDIPTKDDIIYSNVPLFYMESFLLVDYSKIYITPPTFEKIQLSGTSAALENKDDQLSEAHEDNVQTITISYKDYLRETQDLFGQNKFKGALKRYKVILSKYQDDLNAHFYSGLCYFNIGEYNLAIQHFKIAKNHPFNTFQIDAEWYMAKTFYQQGKTESCKKLLEKIIEGGQFYSTQAQKLLKKF